ncbi:MAG TPA: Ig-like domain-containing protein [Allosphingosinicella sp.]|nr:Ig-like domain-containing protein [Allosphingosinicella sp.]
MPANLTVTRSTSFFQDNDEQGVYDVGDVLYTRVTINNIGTTSAFNVSFQDNFRGTTLVNGTLNVSPIATSDSFTAVANTVLRVGGAGTMGTAESTVVAGNLLTNDRGAITGDQVPGLNIDVVTNGVTAKGGAFNIFSDGSFNYLNDGTDTEADLLAGDSFTYTVRDAGLDGMLNTADDLTSTATVTITFSLQGASGSPVNRVWYVDGSKNTDGTGTSLNPFQSSQITSKLSSVGDVDDVGHVIYVKNTASGSIALEASQKLIGTGEELNVGGFLISPDGGTNSALNATSGFAVTLSTNNTIAGVNLGGTGGITGTSFGTLTVTDDVVLNTTGTALSLTTGTFAGTGFAATSSGGGVNNVALTGVAGTIALGTTGTLTGSTGAAFLVSGGSVSTTFAGSITHNASGQAAVSVVGGHAETATAGTGTLTFTGTVSGGNGTGLQFTDADGFYNFNGTTTLNSGHAGIGINAGSDGDFNFGSLTNLSHNINGGDAFIVKDNNANVTFAGSIGDQAGKAVNIDNHDGGTITFTSVSTISSSGGTGGVSVTNSNGGTVNFNGSVTLSTSTGTAVNLTGNTGSTINFTNAGNAHGGLDITTTSGKGFVATGGGTVTVQGSGNTIASTTGTALEVQNTTIGSGGLNFVSIAANGAVNGILLNNTGTTAGLTVAGDGGGTNNGSGGTIQNSSGDGILLTNTENVRLAYMNIQNNLGDGIGGSNVNGFVLNRMNVSGNGNDFVTDESGINILNLTGTASNGLRPTSISNSVFSNNHEFQIQIVNTAGTLTDFDFTNNTLSSNGATQSSANLFNFLVESGTASMRIDASGNSFTGAAPNTGTGLHIDHSGSGGTMTANVLGNTFTNNNVATTVAVANGGNLIFNVDGNIATGNRSHGLNLFVNASSTGTVSGHFQNNTVGTAGTTGSGSQTGFGIRVQNEGSTTTSNPVTVRIHNNTVQEMASFAAINVNQGIAAQLFSRTTNVTITDNKIGDVDANRAIIVQQNNSTNTTGSAGITNLSMSGNQFLGVIAGNVGDGTYIRLRELAGGDFNVTQLEPTSTPHPSELDDANNTTVARISVSGILDWGQPAPPQPMLASGNPVATAEELQAQVVETPPVDTSDTGGTQDNQQHGAPVAAEDGASRPVVVDDGILSQAELVFIVEAAIQRWAAAGATDDQIAAMRAVSFAVTDLGGLTLGSSGLGTITLDDDAAGWRWFVDATPDDDSEYTGSGTQLAAADRYSHAGTRIDLLTVVTHELGHQIGLVDTYAPGETDELMFGTVGAGERRLPGSDDAASASGTAVAGAFAISPISLGTIEAGQIVVIEWRHTVDAPGEDRLAGYWTGQSTVTYEGGTITPFTVTSDADTGTAGAQPESGLIDSLSFGNLVFLDRNKNGIFDGTDSGIAGVTLSLFADTNNNGHWDSGDLAIVFDDNNGNGTYEAGIDDPLPAGTGSSAGVVAVQLTATTDANGLYSFAGLAPGDYIAVFNASNFLSGGALHTRVVGVGGKDPNDTNADGDGSVVAPADVNVDNDNNGEVSNGTTATRAVRLDYGQEPGGDVNNSVDVAFVQPNQAPSGANATVTVNEDTARTLAVADFGYTDPEDNALLEILVNSVSGGTLTVNGTAVTTFPATITPAQLNGNQVVFNPTLNLNGTAAASIVFQVRDNGGTDNGGVDTDQSANTITFNLAAVNDPISTNAPATLTLDEDSVNFAVTGLSISDADAALAPGGIYTVSLSSTNGTLTLTTLTGLTFTTGDGTSDAAMTFRGTLANLNTALATAKFTPTANYAGAAEIQLSATDTDGTTVATGTGAATTDSDTIAVTVTAVNDAPVLDLNGAAAGDGASGTAVEQAGAGTGPLASAATVTDVDSANFDTGTLTVSITANGQVGDIVSVQNYSDGSGNALTAAEGTIAYNGTVVATFTAGDHDTPLVVTFDADATAAAVQFVTRAVYFAHTGDSPSAATRTLTYTLTDGDGGSDSATATVSVSAANDAPNLTDPTVATIAYTEGAPAVALMQGVSLSDVDLPANFAGGSLTLSVSGVGGGINLRAGSNFVIVNNGNNTFTLAFVDGQTQIAIGAITGFGTSTLTVSNFAVGATLARLNDLVDDFTYVNLNDNPGSADRTVTLTFNDGNNTGSGSDVALTDTVTQTLQITPVNDAPVNSLGAKIVTSEDATGVWLSGMSISDPDADPANDTVYVTFQVDNGALKFRFDVPGGIDSNDVLAEAVNGSMITLATTLNKINATLAADNGLTYAPKANFNGDDTLTVTSNDGGANGIDPGLTAEATNEETVTTRTIEVAAVNDAPTSADDSVTTSEDDAYTFTVSDFPFSDVDGHTLSGVRITGLPTGGTLRLGNVAVTDEQVISFADIDDGMLTYTPDADQLGSPYDSFKFKVIDSGAPADGDATESGEQTMTINVTPDNLAPVVDLNGDADGIDYSTSYSEGGAAVAIGSGITVTDPDSDMGDQIEGATITITNDVAGDRLTLSGDLPAGITVDPTSTDTVLKLIGTASQADYQAALALVLYSSTSENPALGSGAPDRTITVVVTDGSATSAPATVTITIAAENDGPANSVPGAQSGTEDKDLVFSTANGNVISVSDPDAGVGDMTVTLSVTRGTLTLADTSALSGFSGDGTSSVTLTGRASAINAALDGLVYRGTLNFEGDDTLTILTSDNGLSGAGGEKTDSDEVQIELADDGFINGDSGDNVLNGTPQRDIFLVQQGGNDTVNGLGSRDVFYFGDAFTAEDKVNGGGNSDIVILQGNYAAPTSIGSITNLGQLGSISLFSSSNDLYGGATAGPNDYNLVATNDTVAAGLTLKINATGLQADEDLTFDGSAELDGSFQIYGGQGTDHVTGGAMGDNFVFTSGTWGASDRVAGGGGYDVLYLRGNYNFTFGAGQLSSIESIGLLSATEKVFASGGNEFDYVIEWNDTMLDAGQSLTVNGSRLTSEESVNFNGSSETAGSFRLFGGMGNDVLTGGAGNDLIYGGLRGDTLTGGAGNDIFRYQSVNESNPEERDGIQDFTLGDRIDLSRIDTDPDMEGDQAFTFIGQAAFSGQKGELRYENFSLGGPVWLIQGDVNGDGVSDFEIVLVISDSDPITAGDFML